MLPLLLVQLDFLFEGCFANEAEGVKVSACQVANEPSDTQAEHIRPEEQLEAAERIAGLFEEIVGCSGGLTEERHSVEPAKVQECIAQVK